MAGKKDVEKCSEGLVLITNVIVSEFKKILKEVLNETVVVSNSKPNPIQIGDLKPSVPQLEGDRLIRLDEVLEYLPISKSTWWAGVKSRRYPAPVTHLGKRVTAWRLSDILKVVKGEVAND